jgi:uncharacterized protein YukE
MADSWVGGDIGGLRAMGDAWTKAKADLDGVVKPLGGHVDALVSDAGWQGDAAESFRAAWTTDAMTAGSISELVAAAGKVLTDLADELSTAETALHNAEDIAVGKGVPVGPKGVPGELTTNNPPTADDRKAIDALHDYGTFYQETMHTAQQARLNAAGDLQSLFDQSTAPQVSSGDKVTLYDYLRGLYAYDAEHVRAKGKDAKTKLDDALDAEKDAKKAMRTERKAFQKAGKALPKDWAAKGAYQDAAAEVKGLQEDISAMENGSSKLPYDRMLNYKVADAADALKLGEDLEKLPDFLKEVPVLDVAAAATCGLLEAKDDHDKGWSWTHSVLIDGGAALGGLAAGAAAVALLPEAAGAAVVAGVGGAVVIGATGLIDHGLHEHWSEDIHDHGVVGGVLTGTGHMFSETGGDFVRLGGDVADAGKSVWHGIKSLF